MKNVYASLGFAVGASAAALSARDQCCFSLTASGGVSGVVGQLSDGQNRIDQTAGLANQVGQYCINGDKITDGNGRGCILTPPTTQFQCDVGATPTPYFSVFNNGTLSYYGDSQFYACPTGDNGGYNIYTTPVTGQTKCVSIMLSTGGKCVAASSSAPASSAASSKASSASSVASSKASSVAASSAPASSAPASSAPASSAASSKASSVVSVASSKASSVAASSAPASSAPASSAASSKASSVASVASSKASSVVSVVSSKASSVAASSAPASSAPTSSVVSSAAPVVSSKASSVVASPVASCPAPVTTTIYVTVSNCATSSAPASSAPASSAKPSSAPATSAPVSSAPASSAPASSAKASSAPASSAPASSAKASSAPASSAPASSAPASSAKASSAPASSPSASSTSASACQTALTGAYQTPHAIIPVNSASPDHSYGTQYNAYIGSGNSTIFNFDIPQSYSGKQCSLIFLFPQQSQLQTSSFTQSGSGGLTFEQLASAAPLSATYNSAPKGAAKVGEIASATPGHSWVVATGACAAGTTVSYEVSATGNYALEFFEDWNPSPIGVFITSC